MGACFRCCLRTRRRGVIVIVIVVVIVIVIVFVIVIVIVFVIVMKTVCLVSVTALLGGAFVIVASHSRY